MNLEPLAQKIAEDYGLSRGEALQIMVQVWDEIFKQLGFTEEMMKGMRDEHWC